ncbi:MAG: nucleotidyltransferase domain-containing protein [Chloroflexota bacterium]
MKLASEVRQRLTQALGQPVKVILFDSQARGDATRDSDIDLFVILPILNDQTRFLVSDVAWEVGFEAGKVISAIPTTQEKMSTFSKFWGVLWSPEVLLRDRLFGICRRSLRDTAPAVGAGETQ